jgi:hypothetical protein
MPKPQPPKQQDTDLQEFKELLGPEIASRYTDGQLLQLRREMYEMAELLLDLYLMTRQKTRGVRRSARGI